VIQAWLPYDVPFAVHAFLDRFAPARGCCGDRALAEPRARVPGTGVPIRSSTRACRRSLRPATRKFRRADPAMLEALAGSPRRPRRMRNDSRHWAHATSP